MVELVETMWASLAGAVGTNVQRLLGEAFFEDASVDYYARLGIPTVILILKDGLDVVGHLALYRREVGIGDENVEIGMIGGVVVAPAQRGRGHSRTLVQRAHAYLREQAVPFSVLFALQPRVFQSSGYKPMRNETRFFDGNGSWKTLVYRGGMYAELLDRPWPDQLIDLRGPVV